MDPDLIANFCSITDCTPSTAEYYLNAANCDLDMAIGLFYEAGGRESGDKERDMQTVPLLNSNNSVSTIASNNITLSSNITTSNNPASSRNIFNRPQSQPIVHVIKDSDEEAEEDAVRFMSAEDDSNEDVFTSTNHPPATRSRTQRLADLFRPPHEIMFPGTLEVARRRAREQSRWLLVSMHVPTQFSCQAMNRDCWNDGQIQEFVKENLVFVQLNEGSPDAQRYANFYPFDGMLPHTAIIDPRTGERVKTLLLATIPVPGFRHIAGAGEMLEELVAFTCDNSLQIAQRASYLEATEGGVEKESLIEKDSDGSTITSTNPSNASTNPSNPSNSSNPSNKKSKMDFQMPPEPETSPETITIAFRLPNGSRLKRRFQLRDPVSAVFEVAEAACQCAREGFELLSAEGVLEEGNGLLSSMPSLKNSILTVELKE